MYDFIDTILFLNKVCNKEVTVLAKRRNTEETRELIIGAAIELFIEKGYSRTTLEDIVKRVNLTRGAFYWNFECKKDILLEVLRRYEDFYREIYTTFEHYDSAIETLASFLTCDLNKKNSDNPYIKIVLYKVEDCDDLSELDEMQVRMDKEFTATIENEIARGQRMGEIRNDVSARTLALSVYMMLLGFDTYNAAGNVGENGKYFSDLEIDALVSLMIDMLR